MVISGWILSAGMRSTGPSSVETIRTSTEPLRSRDAVGHEKVGRLGSAVVGQDHDKALVPRHRSQAGGSTTLAAFPASGDAAPPGPTNTSAAATSASAIMRFCVILDLLSTGDTPGGPLARMTNDPHKPPQPDHGSPSSRWTGSGAWMSPGRWRSSAVANRHGAAYDIRLSSETGAPIRMKRRTDAGPRGGVRKASPHAGYRRALRRIGSGHDAGPAERRDPAAHPRACAPACAAWCRSAPVRSSWLRPGSLTGGGRPPTGGPPGSSSGCFRG